VLFLIVNLSSDNVEVIFNLSVTRPWLGLSTSLSGAFDAEQKQPALQLLQAGAAAMA
jgi:hypothetical protein